MRASIPSARASLGVVGLAWTLPFLSPLRSFTLPSFYSEWSAFALGLAAATLLLHPHVRERLQIPLITLVPLGVIAVVLLQLLLGRIAYTEHALVATLYLLWACALILLGAALRREAGIELIAGTLAWWLLGGAFLAAAWALLTHYQVSLSLGSIFINFHSPTAKVTGHIGQPNHFADYLALALASLLYLVAGRRLHAAAAVLVGAVLLLALALTGARAAWLYCVALLALAFWLWRRRAGESSLRLLWASGLCVAGFAIAHWVAMLAFMNPDGAVLSGQRLIGLVAGASPRAQYWREAWSAFIDAPLLGAGFGQFAWHHFQSAAEDTTAFGLTQNAHNIVLHLLAETGLSGALIVVTGVIAWVVGLKRLEFDLHGWWLLAAASVIAIHSQLEFPLWYANFLGITALLLGAGASQFLAVRGQALRASSVAIALAAGWFVAVTTLGSYRDLDRLLFASREAASSPLPEREFTAELTKIQSESLLTPYVDLAIAFALKPDPVNLRAQLDLNTRVMHFLPVSDVVYKQGMLLMLTGDEAAAFVQVRRAVAAYPAELGRFREELLASSQAAPGAYAPLQKFVEAELHRKGLHRAN